MLLTKLFDVCDSNNNVLPQLPLEVFEQVLKRFGERLLELRIEIGKFFFWKPLGAVHL